MNTLVIASPFLSSVSSPVVELETPLAVLEEETPAIKCLIVSDNAMRRLTLEHYVGLSGGLHLVASLCDGVEAYDYLSRGGEVDLVIMNLGNGFLCQEELRQAVPAAAPCWLLIEQMGNVPAFSCAPVSGRLPQPLCLSKFGQLVGEVLDEQRLAA